MRRVTFNEITKSAVQEAFRNARDLDDHLVEAYLARRALDYLVGFNISPILWRKLPGSRSAGRVQSVALKLICEREDQIEKFRADEYWTITARLANVEGVPFTARLTHLAGNKLDKLDIKTAAEARAAVARIQHKTLKIQSIEKKQIRRNPYAPFITSSLQMEASRKLRISASQTMRLAQKLYEGIEIDGETVGLITYMRTDGTTLSEDAVKQSRDLIRSRYGDKYLPDAPRLYKSKAKNAQEAHEAIRPTDLSRLPEDVRRVVDDQMAALYDLIWKRTMASQMENAVLDQVAADISDGTDDVILRATGSTIAFDGFLTLYKEEKEDDDGAAGGADDENRRLPVLSQNDPARIDAVEPEQHFTQPPPRYSEASLVKKLEELGIGRPSTYASIMQVLQDRNYVRLDKRRFEPEDRGRIVTAFLQKFFTRYVDYDFTARLEEELDAIAAGSLAWKEALRLFWSDFIKTVEGTKGLTITEVIDHLNHDLGAHLFPPHADGSDPRLCPACHKGELSLKLGKFGAFVGCSNYPGCRYTRPLVTPDNAEGGDEGAALANEPKMLGTDPISGRTVSLRRGPYGPYVQIDLPEVASAAPVVIEAQPVELDKNGKPKKPKKPKAPPAEKPKRQGLPAGMAAADVTLEAALKLLSLPRDIGNHPETAKPIRAGIGRFGPFLLHDAVYSSIPKDDDIMMIGLNRAVVLIAEAAEKARQARGLRGRAFQEKSAGGQDAQETAARAQRQSARRQSLTPWTSFISARRRASATRARPI